jgi:hypothetical protein
MKLVAFRNFANAPKNDAAFWRRFLQSLQATDHYIHCLCATWSFTSFTVYAWRLTSFHLGPAFVIAPNVLYKICFITYNLTVGRTRLPSFRIWNWRQQARTMLFRRQLCDGNSPVRLVTLWNTPDIKASMLPSTDFLKMSQTSFFLPSHFEWTWLYFISAWHVAVALGVLIKLIMNMRTCFFYICCEFALCR